ncbi:MAG: hypothetical protein CL946_13840 [Ectothiorhodospiraceae bacterium]|nr:hypothetical protein [Ectothiorhodospiraceae bacterium]
MNNYRRQLAGAAALALLMLFGSAADQTAFAQKDGGPMLKAKSLYASAQYDEVINTLSGYVDDASVPKDDKKEGYLLLGRSYLAKDKMDRARSAIENLLSLEPPVIEPDPDRECPPLMKIYYDVRKSKSGNYAIERPDPGIQTIAVLDFMNRSIQDHDKYDPMEKGFAELMINELQGNVQLKLVERERISWILDEIGMENNPELFDEGTAVRLGKQLGVHTVLLGSFIVMNDQIKLLTRLVKVETSEILATEEATGDVDEFFDLTDELGIKVAKKINVTIAKSDTKTEEKTKSLDAMLRYSEGLALVERGDYEEAYQKFMAALKADPSYQKAKDRADSLKPLIG